MTKGIIIINLIKMIKLIKMVKQWFHQTLICSEKKLCQQQKICLKTVLNSAKIVQPMSKNKVFDLKLFWYFFGWWWWWFRIDNKAKTQFNCYCNCLLELSLAKEKSRWKRWPALLCPPPRVAHASTPWPIKDFILLFEYWREWMLIWTLWNNYENTLPYSFAILCFNWQNLFCKQLDYSIQFSC